MTGPVRQQATHADRLEALDRMEAMLLSAQDDPDGCVVCGSPLDDTALEQGDPYCSLACVNDDSSDDVL